MCICVNVFQYRVFEFEQDGDGIYFIESSLIWDVEV